MDAQRRYGEVYNSRSVLGALPNEKLSTIFRELVRLTRAIGVPQNPLTEVVITHMCGLWRRPALSTPSFWNVFCYDSSMANRIPLDRLVAYLERSCSYPLELWFKFTGSGECWVAKHIKMLGCVSSQIHRWRVFQVLSDSDTPIDEFQKDLKNASAPLLEHLAICPDQELKAVQGTLVQWVPNLLLSGSPSLVYLRLDETSFDNFRPSYTSVVQLRFEKRATFNPKSVERSMFDEVLALPHLEGLSVWGFFIRISREAHGSRGPLIKSRRLKNCRLDSGSGELLLPYFLSHVSAPALETLTMGSFWLNEPLIKRDVDRFPSLHTLAIVTAEPQDIVNLVDYMTITRSIRRFVLSAHPTIPFLGEHFAQ